ncbi:hypothetical protein HAALTHF_29620n [Vreelandella aquamarina]|nr:hypothetical protein HAALTHF_29620n [Halomonas axialensis]
MNYELPNGSGSREGITKYNVEPRVTRLGGWKKEVVLVPGQVEDDASIRYGSKTISSNLRLLQAARDMHPQALVVYKPHPDVVYANRAGKIDEAYEYADIVEDACSVISCIEHCDVVHTMTSLVGFDALLRGKRSLPMASLLCRLGIDGGSGRTQYGSSTASEDIDPG